METMEKPMTGTEIYRYFSPRAGAVLSVRDDGATYAKTIDAPEWRLLTTKKPDVSLADWRATKETRIASLPAWARKVDDLPSMDELEAWANDGICESVTGHRVEPDGYGPDGAPSWLIALGLI